MQSCHITVTISTFDRVLFGNEKPCLVVHIHRFDWTWALYGWMRLWHWASWSITYPIICLCCLWFHRSNALSFWNNKLDLQYATITTVPKLWKFVKIMATWKSFISNDFVLFKILFKNPWHLHNLHFWTSYHILEWNLAFDNCWKSCHGKGKRLELS